LEGDVGCSLVDSLRDPAVEGRGVCAWACCETNGGGALKGRLLVDDKGSREAKTDAAAWPEDVCPP
jgi:hypothetical protein